MPICHRSVSHLSAFRFTRALYMFLVWLHRVSILLMPPSFLRVSRRKVCSQGLVSSIPTSSASTLLRCKHLLGDAKVLWKINWCSKKRVLWRFKEQTAYKWENASEKAFLPPTGGPLTFSACHTACALCQHYSVLATRLDSTSFALTLLSILFLLFLPSGEF